jgi:hypothetical protein
MSEQQEKVEATLRYMSVVTDPPPGKTKSRSQFINKVASKAGLSTDEVETVFNAALTKLRRQRINVNWEALQS